MTLMPPNATADNSFDLSFKVFHELMNRKVNEVLLACSPYDAYIMEEEGRLAQRIIHEYRGLNLSRPPCLTYVSSAREALETLSSRRFDFVISTPRLDDMPAYRLGREIKARFGQLPVFLLTHNPNIEALDPQYRDRSAINRSFVWGGNADLLLALIKNEEDRMNVEADTERAMVRVIILVEDSPLYFSSFLPILYKEIVSQTQAVMEESLNEEHRFFRMRARPKILMAESFEEAQALYQRFRPYLLSVLSDVRYPKDGKIDPDAGVALLRQIKSDMPDIPLLLMSSEESNTHRSKEIPATFLNKNSPTLHSGIRRFFKEELGFGPFIFRLPDGRELATAGTLKELENVLPEIPDESIRYHGSRNDFSRWLMARSEIYMAFRLKPVKTSDFDTIADLKAYLIESLRQRRMVRQKGIVTDFDPRRIDMEADFIKIGQGSLGGKARGLAFMAARFKEERERLEGFAGVQVLIPKTLVISTDGFDDFIEVNRLSDMASCTKTDEAISALFVEGTMPDWLDHTLDAIVGNISGPLAVRSSGLLEDVQYQPFSRLYKTLLLPNSSPSPAERKERLARAIKRVFASTFLKAARNYARSTQHRTEQEKMAVMIQLLAGCPIGNRFYPTFTGKVQSINFYPVSRMNAEDGIATISAGLGSPGGEDLGGLRFSPLHPQLLPQFSTVEDILQNSQSHFLALDLSPPASPISTPESSLIRLPIDELPVGHPIRRLCSTYNPEENRIRDALVAGGFPVLTFAPILKFSTFPLSDILITLLDIGRRGMGGPVQMEFAVTLPPTAEGTASFHLLQIRPMTQLEQDMNVVISDSEKSEAMAFSSLALGNGRIDNITDIVWVNPQTFDPGKTVDIAAEIALINRKMVTENRRYLLIGPGRWGSSDRWLGIPVTWKDISAVAAIVETASETLKAEASQGSHFFQNITSAGIFYLTILTPSHGFIQEGWLDRQPTETPLPHLKHIRLSVPLAIKVDGRRSRGVILS
ncbi:MAG: PEP/pyruvate-binding domain-containing protein [Desulfobacterales bacterium]